MKRLISLTVVLFAFTTLANAQVTHIAGQVTGEFNRDAGYGAPNVGAELSGALRLNKGVAVVGSIYGERAVKDFKTNGTEIGARVAGRVYPFPFIYGQFGYSQDGQYNQSYVEVGHSYFAGAGLNFKDRFNIGADYVSNDGTIAQVKRARVHGDLFLPLSKRLDVKISGEANFKSSGADLTIAQSLDPRNFTGQGLRLGVGISLR